MTDKVSTIIWMVFLLIFTIIILIWLFRNQKPNRYFDRKGIWWYILAAFLFFSLLGFLALMDLNELRSLYLSCQIIITSAGIGHVILLFTLFKWPEYSSYLPEFLLTLLINLLGALCFIGFFWLVDTLMNEKQTANVLMLAQAFLCFSIPYLIFRTYTLILQIPTKIYIAWRYPNRPRPSIQHQLREDTINVVFRMSSEIDRAKDLDIFKRSRLPLKVRFGDTFHRFVDLYNEKNPDAKIKDLRKNKSGEPIGWLFWLQSIDKRGKILIDPAHLGVADVRDGDHIYAERVLLDPNAPEYEETPSRVESEDEIDFFDSSNFNDTPDSDIEITER